MDEFMSAMHTVFPRLLVQFEDFATDNAFRYLSRFRSSGANAVFNDDIQGTGAVVLAGFINAARLSSIASGRSLSEHRILFLGAGSAGVGVAMQLMSFFRLQGLNEDEARERIWLADSQGMVYDARGKLAEHKKCKLYSFPVVSTSSSERQQSSRARTIQARQSRRSRILSGMCSQRLCLGFPPSV